jgi:hypothetical protein
MKTLGFDERMGNSSELPASRRPSSAQHDDIAIIPGADAVIAF